jgi:AcrR family transcriptional regulator
VGRSTFYEYFRDKDDVLRHSMAGLLTVLASSVDDQCDVARVQMILEHFRENIRVVRGMMNSPTGHVIISALASLIEERIKPMTPVVLTPSLVAAQLAEALFGLIRAWLLKDSLVPSQQLAAALHHSACTMRRAYMQ